MTPASKRQTIMALKVQQWLDEWNEVPFDAEARRAKPEMHFYVFTLSASMLKRLAGVQRRSTEGLRRRAMDPGIQRLHNPQRSREIANFVRFGHPWSELSKRQRESRRFSDLRKPGWLPTAIVVNILKPGDRRGRGSLGKADAILVDEGGRGGVELRLPARCADTSWDPAVLPMEVIDGQHRLWAFEDWDVGPDFQLPVVAFHGLDISWQAYLFWTINIKPTRINKSLAFDLYPLLRTEDWLERFEGPLVYRETRAQELVESLWIHPESSWHQRINMLGESGMDRPMVSQAAWVRSLLVTYVKAWEGRGVSVGGLFGAPVGEDRTVLPWSRAQQAAFLIQVWRSLESAIRGRKGTWARALRGDPLPPKFTDAFDKDQDLAFVGPHSLLCTDQGVRGVLNVTNDLCYVQADELGLANWQLDSLASPDDPEAITEALESLEREPVSSFVDSIAAGLARYDWRTSGAASLSQDEQLDKMALRGSGGYRELRRQLLALLCRGRGKMPAAARDVQQRLGYSDNGS